MENNNDKNIAIVSYCKAIDSFLIDLNKSKNQASYDLAYKTIYSKNGGMKQYATTLSQKIDDKGLISNKTTPQDVRVAFAKLMIAQRFQKAVLKNEEKYKQKGISFADAYNSSFKEMEMSLLRNKSRMNIVDNNGRPFDISILISSNDNQEDVISESITGFLVGTVVCMAVGYAATKLVKQSPEACSFVRNMADKYPTAATVCDWLSPLDIEEITEQDKLNKGEVNQEDEYYDTEQEYYDGQQQDGEEYVEVPQDSGYDEDVSFNVPSADIDVNDYIDDDQYDEDEYEDENEYKY